MVNVMTPIKISKPTRVVVMLKPIIASRLNASKLLVKGDEVRLSVGDFVGVLVNAALPGSKFVDICNSLKHDMVG